MPRRVPETGLAQGWPTDDVVRSRWQEAIRVVTTAMLTGQSPADFLRVVAQAAVDLVDGDVATIGVPWVRGTSLRLRTAVGYRSEELEGAIFPVEESLSGLVLATRDGLHVADATASRNAYQPICELGDMGPTIIVPLVARDAAFGTLLVARRHGRDDFSDTDLSVLGGFADHAALAIEYGDTRQEVERLAVIEERERIARELHDSVVQNLFAIGLQLQAMADHDDHDTARLGDVVARLDAIIGAIRTTVLELGPEAAS